jgi:hypothetical protein
MWHVFARIFTLSFRKVWETNTTNMKLPFGFVLIGIGIAVMAQW